MADRGVMRAVRQAGSGQLRAALPKDLLGTLGSVLLDQLFPQGRPTNLLLEVSAEFFEQLGRGDTGKKHVKTVLFQPGVRRCYLITGRATTTLGSFCGPPSLAVS
jgi:hypothetical protein